MSPARRERASIRSLCTPRAVQRFLCTLPYNRELSGETLRSARAALDAGTAHCLEAALIAAMLLGEHGYPPLLLDLESRDRLDHVLFVYREGGRYGAVARSRDPGLHGRRPVFRSLRALVQSYVLPYIDATGRIVGYGLLDLRALPPRVDWRGSERNVWAVERALIANDHVRLRTSTAVYRRWRRRYLDFIAAHPGEKPVYYPGRRAWW